MGVIEIRTHFSQPHATMKTITDNVTASTYACRTIICILPPCPAYVMEMPAVWNLNSTNVSWQSKVQARALGLKVLFYWGLLSRKLMSRGVFLLFLLVTQPPVQEEHAFLNTKFSRRPSAQLHTPLADSYPRIVKAMTYPPLPLIGQGSSRDQQNIS